MHSETQPSTGIEDDRRARSNGRRSAPTGIKIIAVLGLLGSLLGAVAGLALFGHGVEGVVLGLLILGLSVAQAYVLIELLSMTPWAHTWAVVLYVLGVFVNLATLDVLGALLSGLIAAYVWSKRDCYRASGKA